MQPLFRDVAAAVRESQPEGDVVLLSSPLGSTGVGYYGRFNTTGTWYWENADGLKTAAGIFSAPSTEKAAALVKSHGITHIAMIADENFVAAYFQLLHPHSPQEAVKECFGYRLGVAGRLPSWLRMLPYRAPPDVAGVAGDVRLYQVKFDQTPAEATFHLAIAQRASGDVAAALKTLDVAARMAPDAPEALLCKGELLLQGGRWGEAAEAWQEGITRAPASKRGELYASAGNSLAGCRAYALAVKMYRLSLDEKDDAEVMRRLEQTSARIEDPGDRSEGGRTPVP
jgi:tetratricopeptide (TPR) repeat protein